jgi:hypothetical protein
MGQGRQVSRASGTVASCEGSAKSINTLHRLRPDGSLNRQIVAELVQQREVLLDPADMNSEKFAFRGGTTLLINRQGDVRYSISKPLDGPEGAAREERQRQFIRQMQASFALAPYVAFDLKRDCGFHAIHRGY